MSTIAPSPASAPEARATARHHLPFRTVALIGAGTMGAQIAAHLANAGASVYLLDLAGSGGNRNAPAEEGLRRALKMKPAAFFADDVHNQIKTGNLEDDIALLADADWVIEAVVERLDVKRRVLDRVEALVRDDTVISTNTSGIPIGELCAGRDMDFCARFLGTHFFNPPRYLRLVELIPTAQTSEEVLERVSRYARIHLGKGVVVARDTPYFIGNRIGVYAMLRAMRYFTDGTYSIEEIDRLTGPLVGRPKSATFRTADVVGLDVLLDVAENMHASLEEDERRDAFIPPELLRILVQDGRLGAKSGSGFYRKNGNSIQSVSRDGQGYGLADVSLDGVDELQRDGDLASRLRKLYGHDSRAGHFFRETMLDLIAYSVRRIPEITEHPANIDRAMRWGFGWEMGPLQSWDAIGFERVLQDLRSRDETIPSWIEEMRTSNARGFYHTRGGRSDAYLPSKRAYLDHRTHHDEVGLSAARSDARNVMWEGAEAALLDIGECVAVFEFRSKGNSLSRDVMRGLVEAIEVVEMHADVRGMVIANEGKHFSVGANLAEFAAAIHQSAFDDIDGFVRDFQEAIQRVHFSTKPVVAAAHGMVLGGGCELLMGSTHPVAAAESNLGLVELGVGLIPAGTGTMRLAALASERAPGTHPSHLLPSVQRLYEQVARGDISGSAAEAIRLGYLPPWAVVVMNAKRRLYVAREEVIRLSNQGYRPPPAGRLVRVLGSPGRAALEIAVEQVRLGGFITEYDAFLARQLAYVITGGALSGASDVTEKYLLELEREVFLRLAGEPRTHQRIDHMLRTKKPLRN